jgi:hypothetical protein
MADFHICRFEEVTGHGAALDETGENFEALPERGRREFLAAATS